MSNRAEIREAVKSILESIDGLSVGIFDTESISQSELPRAVIYTKNEQVVGSLDPGCNERKLSLTLEVYTGGVNAATCADEYLDKIEAAMINEAKPLADLVEFFHLDAIALDVLNNDGALDIAIATLTYQINYIGVKK